MNIFFTNADPIQAANEHNSIHRNKMIVEYMQLLSTTHHMLDQDNAIQGIYKLTHKNHPSAVWVRKSKQHYLWLLACTKQLLDNYTMSTDKAHASQRLIPLLENLPSNLTCDTWVNPPVAAPDEFKSIGIFQGTEKAYQLYLCSKFAEWQAREKPLKVVFCEGVPGWYTKIV